MKRLSNRMDGEKVCLQQEIKLEFNHETIIGTSDELKYVLYKVEQIAPTDTTVLISGETGTGKELVAREIHRLSSRKSGALLKINCAALPSTLVESKLFSHGKGAFTGAPGRQPGRFEVPRGATLFLDEIGELPLELQAGLLKMIRDGEYERLGTYNSDTVKVRIIAATSHNLESEVRLGRFREDLRHHLNAFQITLPPLRNRLNDLPRLVDFFVEKYSKRLGKSIETIPMSVMAALQTYPWPGNIRELETLLERAVIHSSGPVLRLTDELKASQEASMILPATMEPPQAGMVGAAP